MFRNRPPRRRRRPLLAARRTASPVSVRTCPRGSGAGTRTCPRCPTASWPATRVGGTSRTSTSSSPRCQVGVARQEQVLAGVWGRGLSLLLWLQVVWRWRRSSAARRSTARRCCCWRRTTWWGPWTSNWAPRSRSSLRSASWKPCSRPGNLRPGPGPGLVSLRTSRPADLPQHFRNDPVQRETACL